MGLSNILILFLISSSDKTQHMTLFAEVDHKIRFEIAY